MVVSHGQKEAGKDRIITKIKTFDDAIRELEPILGYIKNLGDDRSIAYVPAPYGQLEGSEGKTFERLLMFCSLLGVINGWTTLSKKTDDKKIANFNAGVRYLQEFLKSHGYNQKHTDGFACIDTVNNFRNFLNDLKDVDFNFVKTLLKKGYRAKDDQIKELHNEYKIKDKKEQKIFLNYINNNAATLSTMTAGEIIAQYRKTKVKLPLSDVDAIFLQLKEALKQKQEYETTKKNAENAVKDANKIITTAELPEDSYLIQLVRELFDKLEKANELTPDKMVNAINTYNSIIKDTKEITPELAKKFKKREENLVNAKRLKEECDAAFDKISDMEIKDSYSDISDPFKIDKNEKKEHFSDHVVFYSEFLKVLNAWILVEEAKNRVDVIRDRDDVKGKDALKNADEAFRILKNNFINRPSNWKEKQMNSDIKAFIAQVVNLEQAVTVPTIAKVEEQVVLKRRREEETEIAKRRQPQPTEKTPQQLADEMKLLADEARKRFQGSDLTKKMPGEFEDIYKIGEGLYKLKEYTKAKDMFEIAAGMIVTAEKDEKQLAQLKTWTEDVIKRLTELTNDDLWRQIQDCETKKFLVDTVTKVKEDFNRGEYKEVVGANLLTFIEQLRNQWKYAVDQRDHAIPEREKLLKEEDIQKQLGNEKLVEAQKELEYHKNQIQKFFDEWKNSKIESKKDDRGQEIKCLNIPGEEIKPLPPIILPSIAPIPKPKEKLVILSLKKLDIHFSSFGFLKRTQTEQGEWEEKMIEIPMLTAMLTATTEPLLNGKPLTEKEESLYSIFYMWFSYRKFKLVDGSDVYIIVNPDKYDVADNLYVAYVDIHGNVYKIKTFKATPKGLNITVDFEGAEQNGIRAKLTVDNEKDRLSFDVTKDFIGPKWFIENCTIRDIDLKQASFRDMTSQIVASPKQKVQLITRYVKLPVVEE